MDQVFSVIKRWRRGLLLSLLPTISATAYSQETEPPSTINLLQFPGAIVDKVIVPVPGEIFVVLDKLGNPDWTEEIQLPDSKLSSDRVRLALVFGGTVAEGFIAVQAEDPAPIRDVGRRVLELADALALRSAVLPHYQSIDTNATRQDWRAVRLELDKTEQTVRSEMQKMLDDEMAELVSIGGWLRGTKAVSALITENYSDDKAEVLNQPDLVVHFENVISGMSERTREKEDVKLVAEGLRKIREVLEASEETGISDTDVAAIGVECDKLLGRFYFEVDVTGGQQ